LFDLFREEAPELWAEAATAIAGIKDQSIEATFLKALEAQDLATRQNAAWALGRVGGEWAITPLIDALEDPIPEVRQRAAWALGQIKDTRAIRPLIRVFNDKDRSVAEGAAQAIANIGQPAVEPLLNTLSAPSEQARRMAIVSLSRIGVPAISSLIEALGDKEESTKKGALEALSMIGESAIDSLLRAIKNKQMGVVKNAIAILGRIGGERAAEALIEMLATADYAVREDLISALVVAGKPAVEPLIEALGDERVDEAAVEVLHRMAGDPVMQDQVIDSLIRALPSGRPSRKVKETLQRIKGPAVEPLLLAMSHDDGRVRGEAAAILGQIGDERAIRLLVDRLGDTEKAVWEKAAKALGAFGDDKIEKPLRETLYKDGKPNATLIEPIGAIRTEAAKRILNILLEEKDREIRVRAAHALEIYYGVSAVDLYTLWKPTIEERLLKRGIVSTRDLVSIAEPLARVILRKYLEDNQGINLVSLEEDSGLFEIGLKNRERIQRLFESWETARSFLHQEVFVHCITGFAEQFASLLGLSLTKPIPEECGNLYAYILDISMVVKDITTNVPEKLLLVFLRSDEFGERELKDLRDLLIEQLGRQYKISLMFLFGESEELKRAKQLCDKTLLPDRHNVVVIGKSNFQRVVIARDCHQLLLSTIIQQADLTTISPFVTKGPVPAHMFFGRKREVANVLESIKRSSLAIVGGRRIGKTSFLQEVGRQLVRLSTHCRYHPVYISCQGMRSYKDFMHHIGVWTQLPGVLDGPGSFYASVALALRNEEKIFIFLLDEIEALLEVDIKEGEQLVKTFRDLFNEFKDPKHGCRFIFSGERYLNQQLEAGSSPLLNFCEVVHLGFLDPENAEELISRPMREMNIEVKEDILKRIADLSSCHPRIIQFFGGKLVEELDKERGRRVTIEHFKRVAESYEFREAYLSTFWGGDKPAEGLGPFERIVALIVIDIAPAELTAIHEVLLAEEVPHTLQELKEALRTLLMYQLIEPEGQRFKIKPQYFPEILSRTRNIQEDFEIYREQWLRSYRQQLDTTIHPEASP
jgi:HEAT repeat protein